MRAQRASDTVKGFDESYEEEIQRLLDKTGSSYIRHIVYCYRCKGTFKNPHGRNKAPEACLNCGVRFSAEIKCALPDFMITERYYPGVGGAEFNREERAVGFVLVHGEIHFKNEEYRMHDYHQYVEMLANGYKVFVILNETIRTMVWSVRLAWLAAIKEAMKSDEKYLQMFEDEKELGYLQKAVLQHYKKQP